MAIDTEPKTLNRRDFLKKGAQVVGAVAVASILPQTARESFATPERKGAETQFYKSAFIPETVSTQEQVGYGVSGPFLEAYKVSGEVNSTWGPPRSSQYTSPDGNTYQLFANALVTLNPEDPSQVQEVSVIQTLEEKGLDSWMWEYGFKREPVPGDERFDGNFAPLWKVAVASGLFVSPDALVPRPENYDPQIDKGYPVEYHQGKLALYNLDSDYGLVVTNKAYVDRLLDVSDRYHPQVNFYFVSSLDEIPGPIGVGRQGDDRKKPWIGRYLTDVPYYEYSIQSPSDPNTFNTWLSIESVHSSEDEDRKEYAGAWIGLYGVQANIIGYSILFSAHHQRENLGIRQEDMSQQEAAKIAALGAYRRDNKIYPFILANPQPVVTAQPTP